MPNTLTNLIAPMHIGMDTISKELTGMIAGVSRDMGAERAAIGQKVVVPVTGAEAAADNTPGVTPPNTGDTTVGNVEVEITKSRHVPIRFNGEETLGLRNTGIYDSIVGDRIAQGMRTLINEIELDLVNEAYRNASRAYGTPGTTPFATAGDLSDFAGVLRILEENGAPRSDLQLALGHAAIGNLRGKQSGLFKVNEAGRDDMLRNGMTDRIMNMAIRHSHQLGLHTKGNGAGYLVNAVGGVAVGGTAVATDTGTGTIVAGDIVTFAADAANKYVVNGALAAGAIRIGAPGARVVIPNDNAITVGNNYAPNVGFARSAIVLATRLPAMPDGGDAAADAISVTDPLTGLTFELALYKQFLQNSWHLRIAYGFEAIKPEHIALLIG